MKFPEIFKNLLIAIVCYLILFYTFQFINPGLSWYQQSLLVGLFVLAATFKFMPGTISKKFTLGIVSVFMAFVLSFMYSNIAAWYASDLCYSYISQKMEKERIENRLESNGLPTVVNLTDQCASEYLPFPWFSKPKS